mmetsp:Transcript_6567/g.15984  ORF Transcript_6567/g.15984 Transcript_6567/m.15984 type:complete len:249 (+) Transcript_6567:1674-2420(+)
MLSFFALSVSHLAKEFEAFLGSARTEGAVFSRFGQRPAVFSHFLCRQRIHVGVSSFDERFGTLIDGVEIARRFSDIALPRGFCIKQIRLNPLDIFQYGFNVFLVFLGGIGVVHSHVAGSVEHSRDGEIEGDSLGMAQVQVSIGFGRESRFDSGCDFDFAVFLWFWIGNASVFLDNFCDKVGRIRKPVTTRIISSADHNDRGDKIQNEGSDRRKETTAIRHDGWSDVFEVGRAFCAMSASRPSSKDYPM